MTIRYVFHGKCKWFKYDKPNEKYNNYEVDLYLDPQSTRLFKKSGLQLQVRDNEDGTFVKFKRAAQKIIKKELINQGPPEVTFPNGEPNGTLVGNGSTVAVTVSVYDTVKGKGHTWESAVVEELVPFGGNIVDAHRDLDDEIDDIGEEPVEVEKEKPVKGKLPANQIPF